MKLKHTVTPPLPLTTWNKIRKKMKNVEIILIFSEQEIPLLHKCKKKFFSPQIYLFLFGNKFQSVSTFASSTQLFIILYTIHLCMFILLNLCCILLACNKIRALHFALYFLSLTNTFSCDLCVHQKFYIPQYGKLFIFCLYL